MLNVISPSGGRVVDIESVSFGVHQHANVYSSTRKQYAFVFGEVDPRDERPLHLRRWQVNRELVATALDWCAGQ